jgi:DNA-binding NtrC family response regulator
VAATSDGRGATDLLKDAPSGFDVVLLDYRLPDSEDLALLASVRRLSPGTAVILMTAFGSPEVARGALDLGAFRVLSKPFGMEDVPGLVAAAHASHPASRPH